MSVRRAIDPENVLTRNARNGGRGCWNGRRVTSFVGVAAMLALTACAGATTPEPPSKPTVQAVATQAVGAGQAGAATAVAAASPAATIRTDPSAFGLVTTNRRPVERFAEAGRWQSTGDTTRADAFARAFKSY